MADDAVGIRVAEALRGRLDGLADLETTSVVGLYLLDYLVDHDFAVIVDAFSSDGAVPGRIRVYDVEPAEKPPVGPSPHYISLSDALNVGRMMGLAMPSRVTVIGIEIADASTVGGNMTPEVANAVGPATEKVMEVLRCTR